MQAAIFIWWVWGLAFSLGVVRLAAANESASGALPHAPSQDLRLQLESGTSEKLTFSSITQATSSNANIARVRQIDERTLLVTARKPGVATVRVWQSQQIEHVYQVNVVAAGRLKFAGESSLGVVRVQMQIVEVSDRAREEWGVHWPQMIDFQAGGSFSVQDQRWNASVRFGSAQGWLRQLMEKGWAKILSQPDLRVVLGEEAKFTSGGEVPFAVLTDSYGRLQQSIQWKQYGLSLKIRPETADGFVIRSDVQVELSDLAPSASGSCAVGISEVAVDQGKFSGWRNVFLSGLVRQAEKQSKASVPILSDIPIIGFVFTESGQDGDRSEVIIAMTLGLSTRGQTQDQSERLKALKTQNPH